MKSLETTSGSLDTSKMGKVIWGIGQSFIAVILLSADGLTALQNLLIVTAFPF